MIWIVVGGVIIALYIVFKFIVKPLFKVVAIVALVLIAWWIFHGGF